MRRDHFGAIAAGVLALATPQAASAQPSSEVPTGMLPRTAVPVAYRVDLVVRPEADRFSGTVSVDLDLKSSSRFLWINGKDLAVGRVIAHAGNQSVEGHYRQVDPHGVARIDFDQELPAGPVTLDIGYEAAFADGDHGLYHLKVGDHWYAWTNDEPTEARTVFPSFDEPGFKTPFRITIATTPGNKVVSNAPETGVTRKGELEVHQFAPTERLPSYLVALAVGPFAGVAGSIPPTPERSRPLLLRVFATAGLEDRIAYPAANTGWFIEHLEDYFGSPFPFQKLDLVASPAMSGGMENAGIVMDDDDSLLFADGGDLRNQQSFAILQAHELAHQWFGDLVTPAWWTDSWLNESFAEWLGIRIGDRWRPQLHVRARGFESVIQSMALDQLTVGRPVRTGFTNSLVDASLDAITYGKGAQVIGMAEEFLGAQAFQEAVRLYISRHRYGNATADDFYEALAEVSHRPKLVDAIRGFIDQSGLPVLTFTRGAGELHVAQSRYVLTGSPLPPPTSWIVPLCLRQGRERSCMLMDKPEISLPASAGTLVPNADGAGYYRFNLPDEDWRRLIAQGPTLSLGEALMTLDSLWAAFGAGKLPPALLVEATRRFAAYDDAAVVEASAAPWETLIRSGWFDESERQAVEAMLRHAFEPRLTKLGFQPARAPEGDANIPERAMRRALVRILALDARSAPTRQRLLAAAQAYAAGDKQALHVDYLETGLTVLVQEGGLPQARALLANVVTGDDAGKRAAVFGAISASDDPKIATWLLNQLHDPRIVARERQEILANLLQMSRTRTIATPWLTSELAQTKGASPLLYSAVQSPFCSAADADRIADSTAPARTDPRKDLSIDRGLERIRSCAALKDSRHDALIRAVAA